MKEEPPRGRQRGFTIAEVVIVLGIVAMSAGLLLFAAPDQLRGGSFRIDRDALVMLLEHARAQAASGLCEGAACTAGAPHGIKILPHLFVLFQGASYMARDARYDAMISYDNVAVSGDDEIVFDALSGNSPIHVITISDAAGQRTSVISIGDEGQISWTH